ncbi:MAG: FAD-dependent monooxygenase [Deltaproteobacteria bacterium]|nr:FAD-dependent monooxygenase [Deltaproteobacteria bacterium]
MGRSSDTEYDVIVAGSGPAGISTAIHLTKLLPSMKNRLIVLEKETHPRKKICGGGVSAYADYWLQRLGIKMMIPSLALKTTRLAIDHDGYVEYCFDVDGFRTVKREEFDEALLKSALDMDIVVAQDEAVVSFSDSDEEIVVQTPKRSLTTSILVGADGAQSIIRRQLYKNAGMRGARNIARTLRFMTPVDNPNTVELEAIIDFSCTFRNGVRGYAWSFPVTIQGQAWINTGICDFHPSQKQRSLLKKILAEFLAARDISLDQGRIEGCQLRWFHPESIFSANRVLLVGDAAGIDPLLGEGIPFSLGYGHVAANSIIQAFKSKDFSFTTYKEQLLEHELGQELMNRLHWADKLYRSSGTKNAKDFLLSLFAPNKNG